jgi:hypothetical protein
MLIKEKGCADFRRSSVRAKGMFCANWYMPDLGAFGSSAPHDARRFERCRLSATPFATSY